MVIVDLQSVVVEQLVFRAIQCNGIYEDRYLLGTSLARPVACQLLSHGCTGKGNNQVRFELAFKALNPSLQVIAPWRLPEFCNRFHGRQDLLKFAADSGSLEDPDRTPPWKTLDPLDTPDAPTEFSIHFENGVPVKVVLGGDQGATDSIELFKLLNKIGHDNGVGRIDIVGTRLVGITSRAHLDLEGLVMDSQVRGLRDQFVTRAWREFIEKYVIFSQQNVTGQVRMMAYKGNVRQSPSREQSRQHLHLHITTIQQRLQGFRFSESSRFPKQAGANLL
ncbi:hypothetical protein V8E54_013419 [Elaphomyces granulatus]